MIDLPTSPSSSNSSVRRGVSKSVRLRLACNQCCSAKVKCSGERSGCERCRNLQTECAYSESRVGKVPGIRAKNRQEHSEQQNRLRIVAHREPSVTTSNSSNPSSLQADANDPSTQWLTDTSIDLPESETNYFQDADTSLLTRATTNDFIQQLPVPNDPVITSIYDELSIPAIDFRLDSLLQPFPTPAPEPIAIPTPSPTRREKSSIDSQIVIDCTQIIGDLENYIVADLRSFKIVFSLVKRALEKVVQLSNMQQDSQNARCMVLLVVMMHQIIELLEACYAILTEEPHEQRSSGFGLKPVSNALLPGLGSGGFGIDAEEQKAWRTQMVSREVWQAMDVIRKLKKRASLGGDKSGDNSFQGRSRNLWYEELELRLTDLIGRFARR